MAEDRARETVAISSCVRGYHVYKDRWKPRIGEKLACIRESANTKDRYAVAVVKNQDHVYEKKTTTTNKNKKKNDSEESITVGHLPRKISCVCLCLFDAVVLLRAKYLDAEDIQQIYSRAD